MKIINDCLILNKEEADKIIPILLSEYEFNAMIVSAHNRKAKEFNPKTIEHARKRLEDLHPFICDWMNCEGTFTDGDCRTMKNMPIDEVAEYIAERTMRNNKQNPDK